MISIKKIQNNNDGFNLAELLVAVSVLVIAITAIMNLVISNINVQSKNEDYLVASMLAQEGLELVRNIRDRNWLYEPPTFADPQRYTWDKIDFGDDDFIIDTRVVSTVPGDPYFRYPLSLDIDDADADLSDITDTSAAQLYLNAGFYDHDNSTPANATRFYRIINIDTSNIMTSSSTEITAIVQWKNKRDLNSYKASTILYDWR